ncbi:transcription elongation factor [Shewanella goraebulensis]|uniref:transcription elongation factor n=1 Tax=Shewanella goraebulensis TaxID=3050637 RepID=UPI00254BAB5B|nr:transcription elongation factor [Shewanella goraebulensis]
MTEKESLQQNLLAILTAQRQTALAAAEDAHNDATNEQSVAETQYDTIGLEAAYLAHGQSQRVADIEVMIKRLNAMVFKDFDEEDEIALGAIITLQGGMTCWLMPVCGGIKLDDGKIVVITPQSPLGQKLDSAEIGEKLDDGRLILAIR